jgi:nucleotide-binding universal stress UspA family protein
MQETIICGVDGSADSLQALRTAGTLAERLGARLVVAHVAHPTIHPRVGTAGGFGRMPVSATLAEFEREAAEAIIESATLEAGVKDAERRPRAGDPAESLADLSDEEDAALIVVGSRGRGAFKAAFLGSVSNSLIGITRCPVLVVPPGAARPT